MCGIVGIASQSEITQDKINAALTGINHRGPDSKDTWIASTKQLAFGHARLSIIDLKGGAQPMSSSDKKLCIIFNGEIYNYKELKKELTQLGHLFQTNSDTEVLIYAYRQWGKKCVEQLRGMFAFAIADNDKKEIFIARDQLGIKPLVYYKDNKQFIFASEIQAIKAFKGIDLTLDITSIDQYLWLQYVPSPNSAFKQIKKLPPAHYLVVSFEGEIKEIQKYWELTFQPDYTKTEPQWIEETELILKNSVKAHLVADVPFGGFLSGGIDSSLIVTYMSQLMNQPVKTFSIGFEEQKYNELPYAQTVANYCQTDHHTEIVRPHALSILPDLVKHYGEPFGDSSAIPTYYVSQMAKKNVTMVLSGDGGDELFAGYNRYLSWMEFLYPSSNFKRLKMNFYPLANQFYPNKFPSRKIREGASLHNLIDYIQYIPFSIRKQLWNPAFYSEINEMPSLYKKIFKKGEHYDAVNTIQNFDINSYLPLDILTKVDIASMMNSLESRTPLVDIKVAEFAATIPSNFNLRKVNGQWEGKIILKKMLEKYYSKDFVYRKKMGFGVPLEAWFGNNKKVKQEIEERILGINSSLNLFFSSKKRKEILMSNRSGWIWLLLFLEEWLRQNL